MVQLEQENNYLRFTLGFLLALVLLEFRFASFFNLIDDFALNEFPIKVGLVDFCVS